MPESVLVISNLGFPPLSLRGCTQELIPIPNGEFKKTINGELVFVRSSNIQKYKTVIKCSDVAAPAIGNLWIGSMVNISCIQNIWQSYDSYEEEVVLLRPPVQHSVVAIDKIGNILRCTVDGTNVRVLDKSDSGMFIAFRPCIKALITDFKTEFDEWNMKSNWSISACEV